MSVWDLWLPIVLSGLATHIWSTLAWTVFPYHKPSWNRVPNEDGLLDWLDQNQLPAEQYLFPHAADGKEMQSEAYQDKMKNRCRGMLILWPEPPNMGVNIGKTITFFFVAAFTIGYLASLGLEPGAPFMRVLQFVGTAGILTHCAANFPGVFWFKQKVAMVLMDGLVYALLTGVLFAALWPEASGG